VTSDRPTDPDAAPFPPPPGLPDSLMPGAARAATTEPAPNETADAVLAALGPILAAMAGRIEEAISIATDGAGKAATAINILRTVSDGVTTLRGDFETYRQHAMDQLNRDGARREDQIKELRQSVTDIEQRAIGE
jgi:hypothetical protein